jgi:hypothetical protein
VCGNQIHQWNKDGKIRSLHFLTQLPRLVPQRVLCGTLKNQLLTDMPSTRLATDNDMAFVETVFLRAMRVHITATRGFWDEAKERKQFREQLKLERTWVIEHSGVDVGSSWRLRAGRMLNCTRFASRPSIKDRP